MSFPIDLSQFRPLALDPSRPELTDDEARALRSNIELARDAIVFFTAVAGARGLGGHTGGAYDIVPELLIADGLMRGSDAIVPVCWDEAGHRVAAQYLLSVLRGHMEPERLLQYREAGGGLPGHPERDFTPGVEFSSGRLGHLWPFVNGVARAHPDKKVVLFGSDGSQQEGNSAEAARLAVAQQLEVKLLVDVNDVTIAGFPSDYMPGFDVGSTLGGAGLSILRQDGEDVEELYRNIHRALHEPGPVALSIHRKMAPAVPGIEGQTKGHDVIDRASAERYFEDRDRSDLAVYLRGVAKETHSTVYLGSNDAKGKNRDRFGVLVADLLDEMAPSERVRRVVAIDSDLEGSCGLHHIRKRHPEVYVLGGVQERGNFSAAAGFGSTGDDRQGIFGTFSAFSEMILSELTMARLNHANVLCHFSHAGVDDMADNTCHFGINLFFLDGGLAEHDETQLYFPADQHQFEKVLRRVFHDPGVRILGSTRSTVPDILNEDGTPRFGEGYSFEPGKDDIIREGKAGWIVSYGEMLYRALDAVERLRADGLDVGLLNKVHLNAQDDAMLDCIGNSGFVLVVESQNRITGLGSRLGTWLLQRGHRCAYDHLGVTREGLGGLWHQIPHQGLDPDSIQARARQLAG
ncbi:MAG: transketolase [Thermoanaerobaculia bacterium]|nr:transketolase [Thermoanaerobaculia bacterium]